MTEYYGVRTVLDPETPRVTHSDLASFKSNRLGWFLGTYLGIRPKNGESPVSPLALGTIVHNALELRYREGIPIELATATALKNAAIKYKDYPYFPVHEWDKQAELCQVMLEGYDNWLLEEHLDSNIRTMDVERSLAVPLEYRGQTAILQGRADHIVENRLSGETMIYDWKTTANLERTTRMTRTNEQLPYYMILEESLRPEERVSGAAYTMLLKSKRTARSKPPYFKREIVRYGPTDLDNRRAALGGAIRDYLDVLIQLHAGVPNPLVLCYPNPTAAVFGYDPYAPLIDVLMDGGRVKAMVEDQYIQIDPYVRYAEEPASMM